jgi:hypothetical protein
MDKQKKVAEESSPSPPKTNKELMAALRKLFVRLQIWNEGRDELDLIKQDYEQLSPLITERSEKSYREKAESDEICSLSATIDGMLNKALEGGDPQKYLTDWDVESRR